MVEEQKLETKDSQSFVKGGIEKEPKDAKTKEAFYIIAISGGFQVKRIVIRDKVVLEDAVFDDPDAWDQVLRTIEYELSKDFQ